MMKQLTDAQVAQMLRDYDYGSKPTALAKELGVSIQAIFYWLPYVGLDAKWLRYVRNLEFKKRWETIRCARLECQLEAAAGVIMQFQPSEKRRSIIATALRARYGLDRKNANKVVGLGPTAGESKRACRADNVLIEMMREYFAHNPGQGFKLMFSVLLRDQPGTRGRAMQLYAEHALGIKTRKVAKEPAVLRRKRMPVQDSLDKMWSMDFMEDGLTSGERFWLLNVTDDCNREAVIIQVMKRRSAKAVVAALDRVVAGGRLPACIRTDNGGEFKSLTYEKWAMRHGIARKYSRPYTPTDNQFVERFNQTLRKEILGRFEFRSLPEAQRALDDWQLRYNFARPHHALNGMSPMQYAYLIKTGTRIH